MAQNDLFPIVLTFTIKNTPELRRAPIERDPQGAILKLALRYEEQKKLTWMGRVAMDDSRQIDALSTLRDGGIATLRLSKIDVGTLSLKQADAQLASNPSPDKPVDEFAEVLIQVGNHRWAFPGLLWFDNKDD